MPALDIQSPRAPERGAGDRPNGRPGDGAGAAPLADRARPLLSWAVLGMLLLATVVAAATLDRSRWPGLIGDEAAYLMQAESLAWDFDLRYSQADYERFVAHWRRPPEGLILQSGDGGATITYGKPALYSAWLAPLVRLSPVRGPAVANALLLALAALASAWTLRRAVGAAAPLWVAALVFASVTFANVFWAHSDLFLACLTALGLALIYWPEPLRPRVASSARAQGLTALRWATAAALLAAVVLSRPLYAPLALPAVWAAYRQAVPAPAPGERRPRQALVALVAGAALLATGSISVSVLARGSWTPYGGERMGFYSYTGFPEVDLAAGGWSEELEQRPGSGSWVEGRKLRFEIAPRLWAWDTLYFFAGAHVGVIAYFLPGLLMVVAALARKRYRSQAWPLLIAVAATAAAFFLVRPFNFYGGGAALANRYFLPVYPALWFLFCGGAPRQAPAELPRLSVWGAPLLAAALAAPFLWPLWTAPTAYPIASDGRWRYVSPLAEVLLPYETSLDHLKPAGREDLLHRGLWIKRLDPAVSGPPEGVDEGWLRLDPPGGDLLIGSHRPIARLRVETREAGVRLAFRHAEDVRGLETTAGRAVWELTPRPVARHRMWWSDEDVWLYRLGFDSATPVTFRLDTGR